MRLGSLPGWFSSRSTGSRAIGVVALLALLAARGAAAEGRFAGPTSSQPLALSADGALLAVVNPDRNSVSFFDVAGDRNKRIARLATMIEPWGVALLPDGSKAYVANTVSGRLSIIKRNKKGQLRVRDLTIAVGTEPYGLALTPNGTRLYVTNARSSSVSVVDTGSDTVVATIPVGPEPRGLAITNDGDGDDLDETVYVTHFLALLAAGKAEGADDAKLGRVSVIPTASNAVSTTIALNPVADTGFKAAGDALARVAPGAGFPFTTGAYPNQLNGIAIRGDFAFVPNTGVSPNGPVRFDVNTQSLLHVIDRSVPGDAGRTVNLQSAVAQQSNPSRRFVSVPWAMAFEHGASRGFLVGAASDVVVKIAVNPGSGAPRVLADPADPTRVLEIPTGKNPRGIVVNAADTRAYVMNYVSRDVTVIDLTTTPESVLATLVSAPQPDPSTQDGRVHVGRELYNTSIGVFDPPAPGQPAIVGRMSQQGWGSCASCHPFGLSDGATWIFDSGPRRTIAQHADIDPNDDTRQRPLGWSAIFDEEHDLELYIRDVSGGLGVLVQSDGITPAAGITAFDPANAGRKQLRVRGVNALGAIRSFVRSGIRRPISPVAKTNPDVVAGRALFQAANCQQCHGGTLWSSGLVRFTPPPAAGVVGNGQITGELRNVGTFDAGAFNEVRQNAAAPLGASGFAPPSLLSVFVVPGGLLHNGAAASLDEVLQNVTHRSAGTSGVDTLTNAADRAKVVAFLKSIDGASQPIPGS